MKKNIQLISIYSVFIFIFLVYLKTMLRGQAFHDAGEFQTVIYTMQIAHPTGFPTYILLGHVFNLVFPFFSPAFNANLLSLLYSFGTLIFVYLITLELTKNRISAIIAVLSIAFVETFWNYAGLADSHTLDRLFFFVLFYILLRISQKMSLMLWILFSLLLGVGLGNHLFLAYATPVFLVWIIFLFAKKQIPFKPKIIFGFLLFLILGLSVYILLPIKGFEGNLINATYRLDNFSGFFRHVLGLDFFALMFQGGFGKIFINFLNGLILIPKEMTFTMCILAIVGVIWGLIKKTIPIAVLLAVFFCFLLFSTNYPTSDPTRYFANYFAITAIFAGLGFFTIYGLIERAKTVFYMKIIFLIVMIILIPITLLIRNLHQVDKSKDKSAEQFASQVLSTVPQNAVILTWWGYYTPLWYQQSVLNKRPDVLVLNNNNWLESADIYFQSRPVFVVQHNSDIEQKYHLESFGRIFKVVALN